MKKRKIQLPKGYLSYSQIQLWKSDKERYKQLYFNNRTELRISNAGMEYGKVVAEALEKERDTGDLMTDSAMLLLVKYDLRDQEITTEIKTKEYIVPVIGRPDTLDSVTKAFREYKTGKGKWTQNKAQKHPQMKFYAMLIYLKYKTLTKEAWLDWIETEKTPEGIKPTGRVESFHINLTMTDILETMKETVEVAKEIEIAFASHETVPEIGYD